MSESRKQYTGSQRSLVVALDIGTTFSGVSYAILEPGEIPKIHGVTRYPGQEHVAGNSKIPSILYYDASGKMIAAGAEADTSAMESQAEDEGWIKSELFKLRLRPRTMKLEMNGMRLGSLPRGKTAVEVFGDFLGYLYQCTRNFIIDTHANGRALWKAVEPEIQFVLSHPNGWEGAQQSKMRRAAEYGGLIPSTNEGRARIRFVTEGEASLHACVLNGLAADVLSMSSKPGFLIADAGGGTLDISSYQIKQTSPLIMEEIAPPDCIFAGSVFVDRRAREFLGEKLKNSKYGTVDALDHIAKRFSETTKRLFRDRKDMQFIPFGSPLDKDISVGIRGGQLKLTGDEVSELFEPSIEAAVIAIRAQIAISNGLIKSVWLVGGFAASPWLFSQLQERLSPLNVTVSRPDSQTSKAVADGAVGFWCDHHVHARMSKYYYGVEYLREFDSSNAEHLARKDRLCELPSGPRLLPDAFDCILARGVKVKESTVFTRKYSTELTSLSMLSVFEVEIWCYRGHDGVPPWILRDREDFSTLCVVRANLANLAPSAQPKEGKGGKIYWTIIFSVEIHFGLTEFKARIKWVDSNGKIKYGPASIVYNESGHRAEEDDEDDAEDELTSERQNHRAISRPVSRANSRDSYRSYSLNEPPPVPELPRMDTPPQPQPSVADTLSLDTMSTHSSHTHSPAPSSRLDINEPRFEQGQSWDLESLNGLKLTDSHLRGDGTGSLTTPQLDAQLSSVWGPSAPWPVETPMPPQSVLESPASTTKTPVASRSPAISRSSTTSKPPPSTSSISRAPSSNASKIGTPLKQSTPMPPSPRAPLAQVDEEPTTTPTTSRISSFLSKAASSAQSFVDPIPEDLSKTPVPQSRVPSTIGSRAGASLRSSTMNPPAPETVAQTPAQVSRSPSVSSTVSGSRIGSSLRNSAIIPPATEGAQTPAQLSRAPSMAGSVAGSVASSKAGMSSKNSTVGPPASEDGARTPVQASRSPSIASSITGSRFGSLLKNVTGTPPVAEEPPQTPAQVSRSPSIAGSTRMGSSFRNSAVIPPAIEEASQTPVQSRPSSIAGSMKLENFADPIPEQSSALGDTLPKAGSKAPSVIGSRAPSAAGSRAPSVAGSVAGTPAKHSTPLPTNDPMPSLAEEPPMPGSMPQSAPPVADSESPMPGGMPADPIPEPSAVPEVPTPAKSKKKKAGKNLLGSAVATPKAASPELKPTELPSTDIPASDSPAAPAEAPQEAPAPAPAAPASPEILKDSPALSKQTAEDNPSAQAPPALAPPSPAPPTPAAKPTLTSNKNSPVEPKADSPGGSGWLKKGGWGWGSKPAEKSPEPTAALTPEPAPAPTPAPAAPAAPVKLSAADRIARLRAEKAGKLNTSSNPLASSTSPLTPTSAPTPIELSNVAKAPAPAPEISEPAPTEAKKAEEGGDAPKPENEDSGRATPAEEDDKKKTGIGAKVGAGKKKNKKK